MKRKLFRAQQEMSDNIFQVNSIKKLRSLWSQREYVAQPRIPPR